MLVTTSTCAQVGKQNYFPLADGARWEYTGYFHSSYGGQYPIRSTMRVEGTTLIHGQRYYKLVINGDFSAMSNLPPSREVVRYYRIAADSIYLLPGNAPDAAEHLAMPVPLAAGARWLSGSSEITAERAGTLVVGAHEYHDCLKLTYTEPGSKSNSEEYLAPGVGIVKMVYSNTTEPPSRSEVTLERYVP